MKQKSVYIFEDELRRCKIGVSQNPKLRRQQIQNASGLKILNEQVTEQTTKFLEIEKYLHSRFSTVRKKGEWFAADFDQVCLVMRFISVEDF